jgi:hypothetical protein
LEVDRWKKYPTTLYDAVSLDPVALSVLEIHALWAGIFPLKNELKKTPGNSPHKPR